MSGDESKAEAAIPVWLQKAQDAHRHGRRIVASLLTGNDVDNSSQVGPLLDQVADPIASFTSDDACGRIDVSTSEAWLAEASTIWRAGVRDMVWRGVRDMARRVSPAATATKANPAQPSGA